MENTLKVTNVFSDPTRFNIYQYLIQHHKEVTVLDVANEFNIHPNVARLHLAKLEDINIVTSHFQKNGKGGRPSRLYKLSDEVIELNFPHRDYKLLSSIAIESITELGDYGQKILYNTGKKYGMETIKRFQSQQSFSELSIEQKINILKDTGTMLGMYPDFIYDDENNSISFSINNCPFKEVVKKNQTAICSMHKSFLEGMLETLFTDIELIETANMFHDCENCRYVAKLSIV